MIKRNVKSRIYSKPIFGFTLIELLVVVSIIALLVSILLPALGRARKQAQKTVCMMNLKQISICLEIYATESEDAMPLIYQRHWGASRIDGLAGDGRGLYWDGLLKEQSKLDMEVFKCPADKRPYKLDEEFFWVPDWYGGEQTEWINNHPVSYSATLVGYGLSGRHIPWSIPGEMPIKRSRISNPFEMHLVWDGAAHTMSQSNGFGPFVDAIELNLGNWTDSMFRHANKIGANLSEPGFGPNSLLADGHVEPTICIADLAEDNFNFVK